jgi:[amino group carrier protein]-L-2-aminoadipate 6-kinase
MTIVVKVGGAAGNSIDPAVADLARRTDYVVVHGGSAEVDRVAAELGRPSEYYTSPSGVVSRRSTAAHVEVLTLAMTGAVQTELVRRLGSAGVRAVGLSGVDGRLLLARRKHGARAVVDGRVMLLSDDRSGTVERVDVGLLRLLLGAGIVPVVGPPAVTEEGEIVNVDADRAAAAVAGAIGAEALVLLTNVPGLLSRPDDPTSTIRSVARSEIARVLPLATGRMKKKVLAAREALDAGVGRVIIAPSNADGPVDAALRGVGTVIS